VAGLCYRGGPVEIHTVKFRAVSEVFRMRCWPLLVAMSLGGLAGMSGAAETRPNVVLIFADDLGYGDLSCYGNTKYQTPHLDQFASEGVRLTDFYVPLPYCAPSRATILTGRYPFHHGLWDNPAPDGAGRDEFGLDAEEVTMAEALRPVGYATSCIGKWHLGHYPQFFPRTQGFDEYYGILYSNDMRPVRVWENETIVEYPVVQATLTQRYTERAVDFIERHREQPFFLYLPHAMPHKPLACSEQFYGKSGAGLYGDAVMELDWGVGTVLAALERLGLDERTLVIFTSDNGPWYGGSTAGLRGMKTLTWEGGLRVPGMFRWTGRIPAGQTLRSPCGTVDVLPTVLAACGVPLPEGRTIDGVDLLPWMTGQETLPDRPLFGSKSKDIQTVRRGRYKLHLDAPRTAPGAQNRQDLTGWRDNRAPDGVTILAPHEQPTPRDFPGLETGDAPGKLMLFDLEADPGEQHNVAAEHPEVVQQLQADYDAARKTFVGAR
jgi:arylsulfatase A-like enzyme